MRFKNELAKTLADRFRDLFGGAGELHFAIAPGRVNLIGEHTDYNDGWVLPMAIERYLAVAFRPRPGTLLRVHSLAFDEGFELDLSTSDLPVPSGWMSYVGGMARVMQAAGLDIAGVDCVIDSDVPVGSGLSSSAALEMAIGRALCAASEIEWKPRMMARLGQQAEHEYVGIRSGVMDQIASALAEPGCAMLLDCRSLETKLVPVPEGAQFVVMDTGARRAVAGSEYNERRQSCEAAVAIARRHDDRIAALRDVDSGLLASLRGEMDETTWRRARHVVDEVLRPQLMADALEQAALARAGDLMNDSHASLRDLYEVSSPELDLITDLARRHPACFGARLTGAGFGGCAVALVQADGTDSFIDEVQSAYRRQVELPSELFACNPAAGAHLVAPPIAVDRKRTTPDVE